MAVTDGIREYMARDWGIFERTKERLAPEPALALADELRVWAQTLHPGWPSDEESAEDLEAHARLAAALRRAFPRAS